MRLVPSNWRLYFKDDLKIMLDGVEVKDCVVADDVEGYVTVHAKDENGFLILENDDLKLERRYGAVTFAGTRREN